MAPKKVANSLGKGAKNQDKRNSSEGRYSHHLNKNGNLVITLHRENGSQKEVLEITDDQLLGYTTSSLSRSPPDITEESLSQALETLPAENSGHEISAENRSKIIKLGGIRKRQRGPKPMYNQVFGKGQIGPKGTPVTSGQRRTAWAQMAMTHMADLMETCLSCCQHCQPLFDPYKPYWEECHPKMYCIAFPEAEKDA